MEIAIFLVAPEIVAGLLSLVAFLLMYPDQFLMQNQ
jgi:hypothetical protein